MIVPKSSALTKVELPKPVIGWPQSIAKPPVRPPEVQRPQQQKSNRLAWFFGTTSLVLVFVVIVLIAPKGFIPVEQPVASSIQPNTIPKPEKRLDEFVQQNKNLPPTKWPQPNIATSPEKVDVSPSPRVFKTGEGASVGGLVYGVIDSVWANKISENVLMNTPPRAAYLIVHVFVGNANPEPCLLPPLKLIDENGAEYAPSHNGWMVKDSLKPIENLNPEVPVKGTIAFDVPKHHQYRLVVRGGIISPERGYILLQPVDKR